MSQTQSPQQTTTSKQRPRYSLLRIYLLAATPIALILATVFILLASWQTRQRASTQLSSEMALLARIWDASPSDLSIMLANLPPSSTPRHLFATDASQTVLARSGHYPNEAIWPIPISAKLPTQTSTVGTTYTTRNQLSGDLYHWWQPRDAVPPVIFVSLISAEDLLRETLKTATIPLLGLIVLFGLSGGVIESVERRRARQFQQLAEASLLVTRGNLATSMDVGGESDLGKLGALFDSMRRTLKERIDNATLLLQVSQDVTDTRDLDHGMAIILRGLLQATDALGVRAIVLNPTASQPLRFGAGDLADEMSMLDRALLDLVRNSPGDVVLRSPDRVRQQLKLPEGQSAPVESLIAFPLYAIGRLHGLLWVGYADAMTHEPSEIDLMRSYVSRAAALVANMRLYALAEGGYRRLAAVLQSTQEAVIVTDQTDRVVLANPALGEAFGIDSEEIIGRNIRDIFTNPNLLTVLTDSVEKARGREISNEAGETFYTSASKVTAKDNQLAGRVAVFHNITRMKQLEAMKSNFVRNVSHDLRNPLAYMHTYASMLPELGELTPKQKEYVANIINGIQRMHDTIGAVLDLNRIESASDELLLEPIDVRLLLHELALEHQPAAENQGNTIRVNITMPLALEADRWALKLALNNLLGNALKYAPNSGEIVLGAQRRRQSLDDQDSIVFFVRDRGDGISKADQLRLFEKYYRAAEPAVSKVEGSGLGLAIVKSIAQRHEGRVWVQSQIGSGSTFYLALPIGNIATKDTSHQVPAVETADLRKKVR